MNAIRARYLWVTPLCGAIGMSVMFATLSSRAGPAFIIWSLFDILVFAVPLGIVGAFPSSLVWWILMRQVRGRAVVIALVSAFVASLVAAATGYLYWTLFPFGGSAWVAALVWGALSLTVYCAVGGLLIKRREDSGSKHTR